MKLRIQDNSLRLRLSIEEVNRLSGGLSIDMTTALGNGSLTTRLVGTKGDEGGSLSDGILEIQVDQQRIDDLVESDEEGFEFSLGETRILVQKDYQCIGRDESLNEGLFPNPKSADAC